jgi:hypothetical protein
MIFYKFLALSVFALFVNGDTIQINTPQPNQIINYDTDVYTNNFITVNYMLGRNGMVYITNTTTDLVNDKGQVVQSLLSDTFMYGNVTSIFQLPIIQTPQAPSQLNWSVIITGYGRYLHLIDINGTTTGQIQFLNLVNTIPITLNLTGTNKGDFGSTPLPSPSPTNNSNGTDTNGSNKMLFAYNSLFLTGLLMVLF